MLIESDKYQPTSLRRGRKQAFEKDLSEAYSLFAYKHPDPHTLTINDLLTFWQHSKLNLIPAVFLTLKQLRCQDEDQQEYFQALHKILIGEYFLRGNSSKKLYAIFCLYLLAYSLDSTFDRQPRPIYVTSEFIVALTEFMRENKQHIKSLFMKVIKRLREHFVYSIKLGFRDPLIKKNGDTLVRYPKSSKKIGKTNFSPALTQIGQQLLPEVQEAAKNYHQAKQQYLRSLSSHEEQIATRRQFSFDKNIGIRLQQILKSYEAEFYDEDEPKQSEE